MRPDCFAVIGSKRKKGRFFTDGEEQDAVRLTVVDSHSVMQLFGAANLDLVESLRCQ